METRKNIVKKYFKSLVENDISVIEEYISEGIQFMSMGQLEHWGKDSFCDYLIGLNNNGNHVVKCNTKKIIEENETVVVEYCYEGVVNTGFDRSIISYSCVSIIEFDKDDKIVLIKEYIGR